MNDDTLVALFLEQARSGPQRAALRTRRHGRWESITWAEWESRARRVAAALVASGVPVGARVAIFASTREEWVIADAGVLLARATTVPIYQTLVGDQAAYILANSGARVLFAEDAAHVARIAGAGPEALRTLESLARIVLFDAGSRDALPPSLGARTTSLADVLGDEGHVAPPGEVERRIAEVRADDLAVVMYTSGTTGPPKGVMLTHGNFAFETRSILERLALGPSDEQLLFLPMAHIFAKILVAMQMRTGFVTAFAESLAKALDNAQEIEPTFMGCVPRLYEKIYQVANDKASQEGEVKRKVFSWATEIGVRVAKKRESGEKVGGVLAAQHHYADRLVLRKIRHRFGKKLRFAISGGAPLAKELGYWFAGAGVTVLEGYGLTETTAATNLSTVAAHRFGTVGKALPGVELRIAADGEVLMRGPNIMRGYFEREADTREVLEPDGWFHSGDIGVIDRDGYLTITDRKKDIIVTAGGKNVAPQNIENLLKQSPWVSQAMVHGDRRPYLVALLTLNADAMTRFAAETGRPADLESLAEDSEVRARVELEVKAVNAKLSSYETIKRFAILPRDFAVDTGELTPTLKVKRKVVTERYRALLDDLYAG